MMMTDQQGPARYGHKLLAHGTPISKLTIILLGSDNTLTVLITILLDVKPSGVLQYGQKLLTNPPHFKLTIMLLGSDFADITLPSTPCIILSY